MTIDHRSGSALRPPTRSGTIAFATHQAKAEVSEDDRHVVARLAERHGVSVEAVPWDAPDGVWERYAAVILRSTWNYHLRPTDFLAWTERVEAMGVPLWNPASVVRWNADKRYLRDLEAAGVPVVPTEWLPRGSSPELAPVLGRRGWDAAVVKPAVSAAAFRTWIVHPEDAEMEAAALAELLADTDALVQPLLSEVRREGEWSFIFFSDDQDTLAFSHAIVKRPVEGDFRVQALFGGTVTPAIPPPPLLRQAERVAAEVARLASGPLLYARIDGVVSEGAHALPGTFLLMEAELIEPTLFQGVAEDAAERFADAIARRVRTGSR